MGEIKNPRRFSLEKDFMNHTTDDLVYGFMRSISTAKPIKKEEGKNLQFQEYLLVKDFKKEKKLLASICGCTTKTIDRKVQKLIEAGLVEEKNLRKKKPDGNYYLYPAYFFPFDYNGKYKIIERDMVKHLVYTRNAFAIRIYLYLLNCSTMKEKYIFTIRELTTEALGYAPTTQTADEAVKIILESFKTEGMVDYHKEWFDIENPRGDITKTERMVLDFVKTTVVED